MLVNNDEFKKVFEIQWTDFTEKMGNKFLELLGETNDEVLEALTTYLDETLTGEAMYKVYVNDTLRTSSQLHFSNVNTYNYIRFGQIKTYTPSPIGG